MTVTPSLEKLKEILKPMTWKERIDYLWTYYKLALAAIFGAIFLVAIVASTIYYKQIQHIYNGALLGVSVEYELQDQMKEEIGTLYDVDGKKQVVDLSYLMYLDSSEMINMETNQATNIKLTAMIAAKSLDYILVDEFAYNSLIKGNPFADVRRSLSADQLSQLEDHLIWTEETEETPSYPMVVDISHTSFAKTYAPSEKIVYLVFLDGSPNQDRSVTFVDYILNWAPKA